MAGKSFVVVHDGEPAPGLRGAVVAIGNFDGVHRGHKAVIDSAMKLARRLGRPAAVMTFEPHPRAFFRPDEPLFRLADEATKLRLIASTGVDGAIVLTFNASLAKLTAEEFVSQILVDRFAIGGAVIGFNFHFGANRSGSPDFLIAQGTKYGFAVEVVSSFEENGRRVSSGPVREALATGNIALATELLGYPWFITGTVVHGDKRGRELGFPTANFRLDSSCALRHGIYAVRVRVGGRLYDAVANFGRRPMFDTGAVLLEVFLFDFSGDLYGQEADVAFIEWIREERMFDGVDALIVQMKDDSRLAREALAKSGGAFPPI